MIATFCELAVSCGPKLRPATMGMAHGLEKIVAGGVHVLGPAVVAGIGSPFGNKVIV